MKPRLRRIFLGCVQSVLPKGGRENVEKMRPKIDDTDGSMMVVWYSCFPGVGLLKCVRKSAPMKLKMYRCVEEVMRRGCEKGMEKRRVDVFAKQESQNG